MAIGLNALAAETTSRGGVAIGINALLAQAVADGNPSGNVAVGGDCMYTLTSGTYNTAVGWSAGALCATGQQNTIVGALAFDAADGSESYNTVIGYAAGGAINSTDANGTVAIGHSWVIKLDNILQQMIKRL